MSTGSAAVSFLAGTSATVGNGETAAAGDRRVATAHTTPPIAAHDTTATIAHMGAPRVIENAGT